MTVRQFAVREALLLRRSGVSAASASAGHAGLVSATRNGFARRPISTLTMTGMDQWAGLYLRCVTSTALPSVFAPVEQSSTIDRARLARGHARRARYRDRDFGYDATVCFASGSTDRLDETHFEYDRATGQITQITYPDGADHPVCVRCPGPPVEGRPPGRTSPTRRPPYTLR